MSSKSEKLSEKLGANMEESLGKRPEGARPPAPRREIPARFRGVKASKEALDIDLANVVPDPNQPRKEFDQAELEGLAHSIRTLGQLQAGLVRWDEAIGKWVLVSGERRFRACQLAGVATFKAFDRGDKAEPSETLVVQVVENAQRKDLNPREQAVAYQQIIDTGKAKNPQELAELLGLAPSLISRSLAILTLPVDVQDRVHEGAISASHGHEIAKLPTPELQREVAAKVVGDKLTRDETRELVAETAASAPEAAPAGRPKGKRGASRGVRKATARKARAEKMKEWKEKAPGSGYRVQVTHAKGIELPTLAESFRQLATQIETNLATASA